MSILEKQQNVIKDCHRIFDYYSKCEKINWDQWWNKTVPYMEKVYGGDPDIENFMRYRFRDLFRELQVLSGLVQWPIDKG